MPRPKKVQETKKAFKVGYVALIGRPNVGKSMLLNHLLGQKIAIVSNKPQTTRISILGIHTTDKGQIIFIDNPGIHKPLHKLNKRMMDFVYSSLETASLICLLIDATQKYGHGDEFVLEILKNVRTPVFLLINKVDIVKKGNILLIIDKYKDLHPFKEIIPISALKGTNLEVLEKLIYDYLPESEKIYGDDEISDQSERFLLAEIIREKVLNHVEKELPWVTAVYIDTIERRGPRAEAEEGERTQPMDSGERSETLPEAGESPGGVKQTEKMAKPRPAGPEKKRPVTYIKATIFVERDNHRIIILGRRGQLIKTIGIEARQEIEEILESKVFLDLHVKVRENWRDSADVLNLIEGQK
jgi:GTP-binding protein Era